MLTSKWTSNLLLVLMLLSGFNFLNQFKIVSIPIFQILIVGIIIIITLKTKKFHIPRKEKGITYYGYYLFLSLIPLVVGMTSSSTALLVYLYGLFPFLLFALTYRNIDRDFFHKMLTVMNLSMLMITILGWLLRLNIIDYTYLYEDVIQSQFDIGYWGIRYLASTRNADYLYPLMGLAISMYFFINTKRTIYYPVLFIFIVTLYASLSRAAIIIATLAIFTIFLRSTMSKKIQFTLIFMFILIINYEFILEMFDNNYQAIISSIFSLESTEIRFSNTGRLNILKDAFMASILNPIGYGINNYGSIYEIFDISNRVSLSAENAYITILLERVWLPFILFMSTIFYLFKRAYKAKSTTLNAVLLPMLALYFLFNYELNNVFACFIFYIVFLDYYLTPRNENE